MRSTITLSLLLAANSALLQALAQEFETKYLFPAKSEERGAFHRGDVQKSINIPRSEAGSPPTLGLANSLTTLATQTTVSQSRPTYPRAILISATPDPSPAPAEDNAGGLSFGGKISLAFFLGLGGLAGVAILLKLRTRRRLRRQNDALKALTLRERHMLGAISGARLPASPRRAAAPSRRPWQMRSDGDHARTTTRTTAATTATTIATAPIATADGGHDEDDREAPPQYGRQAGDPVLQEGPDVTAPGTVDVDLPSRAQTPPPTYQR